MGDLGFGLFVALGPIKLDFEETGDLGDAVPSPQVFGQPVGPTPPKYCICASKCDSAMHTWWLEASVFSHNSLRVDASPRVSVSYDRRASEAASIPESKNPLSSPEPTSPRNKLKGRKSTDGISPSSCATQRDLLSTYFRRVQLSPLSSGLDASPNMMTRLDFSRRSSWQLQQAAQPAPTIDSHREEWRPRRQGRPTTKHGERQFGRQRGQSIVLPKQHGVRSELQAARARCGQPRCAEQSPLCTGAQGAVSLPPDVRCAERGRAVRGLSWADGPAGAPVSSSTARSPRRAPQRHRPPSPPPTPPAEGTPPQRGSGFTCSSRAALFRSEFSSHVSITLARTAGQRSSIPRWECIAVSLSIHAR
eukprot:scaffold215667_cov34-Tisochrysis_lutea.AAC.5